MAIESLGDETARAGTDAEERIEPLLTVEVCQVSGGVVRIAFTGELDRVSAPQARQVLEAATEVGCAEIEVDLRSSRVLRRRGLEAFVDAQHRCGEKGGLLLLCTRNLPCSRARARRPDGVADRLADMTGSAESGPVQRKVFAPGMSRGAAPAPEDAPVVPTAAHHT